VNLKSEYKGNVWRDFPFFFSKNDEVGKFFENFISEKYMASCCYLHGFNCTMQRSFCREQGCSQTELWIAGNSTKKT